MPTFIDSKSRAAFIHIPKTGGCTIMSLFQNMVDMCFYDVQLVSDAYDAMHATAFMIKNKHPDVCTFAIVRDPYMRFASMFSMAKNLGFHDYTIDREGITRFCIECSGTSVLEHTLFKPMTHFTHDGDVLITDYVFRYEAFEEAAIACARLLSLDPPANIPEVNVNLYACKSSYTQWYENNDIVINFVKKHYANDFHKFGYQI